MSQNAKDEDEFLTEESLETQGVAELGEFDQPNQTKDHSDDPREEDWEPKSSDLDLVQRYIREASRHALLSPEKETALATSFHETGDAEAYEKLVVSNLRLVIKIALVFQKYWMKNLLDLIQEGNLGLMHAIKKFDPYRGIKLSYYASFWVKAYILKFIIDNWKLVKIGTTQSQRKLFYNLKREKEKLRALGIDPDPKTLAEVLNVRADEVIEMDQRLGGWDLSLDAPLKEGSDEFHKNFLPANDPEVVEALAADDGLRLFRKDLTEFRQHLNKKKLDILDLRLLADNPMTLDEIGKRHKISRERVRQLEERLIKDLRKHVNKRNVECEQKEKNCAQAPTSMKSANDNTARKPPDFVQEKIAREYPKKMLDLSQDRPPIVLSWKAQIARNDFSNEIYLTLLWNLSLEKIQQKIGLGVTFELLASFRVEKNGDNFSLSPLQAKCLLLAFNYEEVSAAEASIILGMTKEQFYQYKFTAIAKIKKHLGQKLKRKSKECEEASPKPKEAIGEYSCNFLLEETLPLFSGKAVKMKDFLAKNNLPTKKWSEPQKLHQSIFFWLDWKESGLPLFEDLISDATNESSYDHGGLMHIPPVRTTFAHNDGEVKPKNQAALGADNKLTLSSELIELLKIEYPKGGIKKAGIDSSLAKIITSLKAKEISIIYLLGVKGVGLTTVIKRVGLHEKYTAGVFLDEIVLPILAKLNN